MYAGVRQTCLTVLSHLILAGQVKPRGHFVGVVLRLIDDAPSMRANTAALLDALTKRASKGANPVYNHLPEVLSGLCNEELVLSAQEFDAITSVGEMTRRVTDCPGMQHGVGLCAATCIRHTSACLVYSLQRTGAIG